MLRGAIEGVTRNRVYGWIWSPDAPMQGRRVLAFLDEACIGAGTVEEFRPDLKEAGLGDGIAGFNFDLTYPDPADAPRVTVRLDGSDALLVQRRSRVVAAGAAGGAARPPEKRAAASMASLQWMRARGWISQSDFDFLRFFRQLGVYDRTLVVQTDRPDRPDVALQDPFETARHLLLLLRMEEAEVKREAVATARDYRATTEQIELASGPGVAVALWSAQRARLPIIEGSHTREDLVAPDAEPPPAVEYTLGPDRLLFLDARCALGPGASLPPGGVQLFWCAG
jgi:hypothetical protein